MILKAINAGGAKKIDLENQYKRYSQHHQHPFQNSLHYLNLVVNQNLDLQSSFNVPHTKT